MFAEQPVQLNVRYQNGVIESFDDRVPASPWSDPLVVDLPYGPSAVDGAATVSFDARPDATYPSGSADVIVHLDQCVTADVQVEPSIGVDAGP